MSQKEESLDEKIARIRKQNEAIERRKKMIDEEIQDAKRNNALVQLKVHATETEEDKKFGATLYSDQLSPEKKTVKSFEEDIWSVKPRPRKSAPQPNRTDDAWREERKRIDEERIRRQKANSGSWKREWDADKTASSNDGDNRTSRDAENKFDRSSSVNERTKNGGYNYNESRGSSNQYSTNENDNTQSRGKTDNSFRKTYSERRVPDNFDNGKSTTVKTDTWKSNTSDTDKYNNNATKLCSRNDLRSSIQNTSFNTKCDQFDEESWDVKFTHDNVATKLYSKNHWKSSTDVAPVTITNQLQDENWDVKPAEKVQLVKPKPNEYWPGGDARPQVKSPKNDRLSVARNISRSSSGFGNRPAQPVKSPNANFRMSKPIESDYKNTEKDSPRTNAVLPKDMENIVVQVKNLGITSSKREVKMLNDSKSNVPKFNINLNTSGEVDSKTLPSYGSMTFERSDLKQGVAHKFPENLTSPTSIATQMFSNSKISDKNNLSSDANFKSDSCTFNNFQSSPVFQFSATPSKLDFGDIVHNTITPQNVKVIRTIKSDNITLVKESPKLRTSVKELTKIRNNNESKRTKCVEINLNQRKKGNEVKCKEVLKNEDPEDTEVYADDDDEDEEWDDCSDEEIEEEFV